MAEKRRRNNNIIIGLDVGTTKICAIAGEITDGGMNILSVSSHPSTGLRKGVVIDMEATANSIKRAVADVEDHLGMVIKDVLVGIAGSHIKSFNSYGAVGIKGKEVTAEDVERAIDAASAVYVPLDREMLHVLPTDFILDGQEGIKDPVGMAGVRLEVKVYIVTGAVSSVQNLLKCCERAGLEVADIVLQPLASAGATLTDDERDMGIALVDIGGGTTDIAVYKEGWLRHTSVLGIGGNHFTNDISVGLRLPFHEAERVKKKYGSILPESGNPAEVDVVAIDGQVRGIPKKYIAEILQPRCEELLELVKQEIDGLQNNGFIISGLVLTGGSSLLAGFDRMAEAMLSMPVRIGYPYLSAENFNNGSGARTMNGNATGELKGEFNNPMYATGVGLVLYGIEAMMPSERSGFSSDIFNRIIAKMAGWFKNILGKK
ncbi:MAG TPA: cell division protein FtsA [Nitrospiraceae bacterium]|nr:MAG: cell division protein FtsA [Nitrospirae bacterium GWA2_46_11]OGW23773.1 MAG: cell division protein FtsA [Nitrospirae bacterium GWB2_47_37]HAK89370.1 cell division protein FtsA [Nitrospiraceae bacterium]HCZ12466.1 cell division protein FtsA [Nitrospiraceae bacterium]